MFRSIWVAFLISLLSSTIYAADRHKFEPVNEVLLRYGILNVPSASDYPGASMVAVLSLHEYRQYGDSHEKRIHQVVKVLTAEGKDYMTVNLPCFYGCSIDARTIKPDGKIVPVPGKDVVRSASTNRTGYRPQYSIVQFSVPNVEPGDLVEYAGTFYYPYPFFMDDFRFSEPYPIHKGILIITHPGSSSYSYSLFTPQGASRIEVQPESFFGAGVAWNRTSFVTQNVPAWRPELHSAEFPENAPGVRLLMKAHEGNRFVAFEGWRNYAGFISQRALSMPTRVTAAFTRKAVNQEKDTSRIIALVYRAADREIRISDESLADTGFHIEPPDNVLAAGFAAPHDFAIFLAACFQEFGWGSDVTLVNSHRMPEVNKDYVFPAYLDKTILTLHTPSGDYHLDCSRNGMPAGAYGSETFNRFSLVIPVSKGASEKGFREPRITSIPYSRRNRSHVDFTVEPEQDRWNCRFTWSMEGEFQSRWSVRYRQLQTTEFRKGVLAHVSSAIELDDLKEIDFRFTGSSFEITGKGSLPRRKWSGDLEVVDNEFWDRGFSYRRFMLDGRKTSLVLGAAGEFSSTITIQTTGNLHASVPDPAMIECDPVKYSVGFSRLENSIQVKENLVVRDLLVRPSEFESFGKFLDAYVERQAWAVLLSPGLAESIPAQPVRVVLTAFKDPASQPAAPANPAVAAPAAPAKPREIREVEEATCEGRAVITLTGRNDPNRITLTLGNFTPEPIDNAEFDLYYLNDNADEVHESHSPKPASFPIPSLASKQFEFFTDIGYDISKIYVRVQQKRAWIKCGPYWIQRKKSNEH